MGNQWSWPLELFHWIFCNREKNVCVWIVLVQYGPFPQEINGKSVKLAARAVSLNFLHDFTLFVIDTWHLVLFAFWMYGCMSYFCRDFDDDDENVVSWIWLSDNGSKCRKAEVPTDHIYQTLAYCGPFSIPYNVVLWHYIPHIPKPWLYCRSVVHQRKEIQRQNISSIILFPMISEA